MGRTTEKQRSYLASAAAQVRIRRAEEQRWNTERNLTMQEQLLGTQEQTGGTLGGVSAEEQPYAGRYQLDAGVTQTMKNYTPYMDYGLFDRNLARSNDLMEQAQTAARDGDFQLAESLKQQADSGLTEGQLGVMADSEQARTAFKYVESPEMIAKGRLGSPMAQTVGKLVEKGRNLMDPNSVASMEFKRTLTEGGERAIAASGRAISREARDAGLMHGAARNPYAERAGTARAHEALATQRAQLHTDTAQFFESYSTSFAENTVRFGQEWLQNQGQIREQYMGALDNMASLSVQMFDRAAERSMAFSIDSAQRAAASKTRTMTIWAAVIGGVAGVMAAQAGGSDGG